jgi:hypothetical protein
LADLGYAVMFDLPARVFFPERVDVALNIGHVIVVCRVDGVGYGFVDQCGAHLIESSKFDEWESRCYDSDASFRVTYGMMFVGVRKDFHVYSLDSLAADIMASYDETFISLEDGSVRSRSDFFDLEQVSGTNIGTFDITSDRCYYDLRNFLYDNVRFVNDVDSVYAHSIVDATGDMRKVDFVKTDTEYDLHLLHAAVDDGVSTELLFPLGFNDTMHESSDVDFDFGS